MRCMSDYLKWERHEISSVNVGLWFQGLKWRSWLSKAEHLFRDIKENYVGRMRKNGSSRRSTKIEDWPFFYRSYRFLLYCFYYIELKWVAPTILTSRSPSVLIAGGIATAISVVCFPFVSPAFRKICLPYVPATHQQIKNVIRALNGRSGSLIDLGSGDGRIVSMSDKYYDESCNSSENAPWMQTHGVRVKLFHSPPTTAANEIIYK